MELSLWQLILDVFLWVMVFALHALRFPSTTLTDFELQRRVQAHDEEAMMIREREQLLPRLRALRQILETLFIVTAITLANHTFGVALGLSMSVLLLLVLDTVARLDTISRTAAKLLAPNEEVMLRVARDWAWLEWFRPYTGGKTDAQVSSKDELISLVERSRGVLSRDELLRFQTNLSFDTKSVSDVMTPVSVVDSIEVKDTLGPLVLDDLHKTGHSRFPVIDGDIDHVVGILYLHQLVDLKQAKTTVKDAMESRVHYIHQEQSLEHALHGFLQTHHHLFIVVNDYRETVGVLTLEDVVEELLGKKIIDEFDQFDDLRAVAASNPRKNNEPKGKKDV